MLSFSPIYRRSLSSPEPSMQQTAPMPPPPARLLPLLSVAFAPLADAATTGNALSTAGFTRATAELLPLFDSLGTVFHFAKNELETKRMSLVAVQDTLQTLQAVVDADVAANCVTVRGSAARNLHRLASSLAFAAELLAALAADASAPLRAATGAAYAKTLANYHTLFLRAGIRASTYLLPDRASLLRSLGETEASAREEAEKRLVPALRAVVAAVEALFVGVAAMPVSEVRFLPSS